MANRRTYMMFVATLAAAVAVGGGATWAAAAAGDAPAMGELSRSVGGVPQLTGRTVDVHGPAGQPTSPVQLGVGDILVVHLEEQAASTGYSWCVGSLPGNLILVGDVVGAPESDLYGAPSDHVFRFLVTGSGTATLPFSLLRAGRGESAQDVTVTVTT